MACKILFFGDDEPIKITDAQHALITDWLQRNPGANFIKVGEELINIKSIKRIYKPPKDKPLLLAEKIPPIRQEFLDKHKAELKKRFKPGGCY